MSASGPQVERSRAIRDFIASYFEDEDAGTARPLQEYQARSPDHATAIAQAYQELGAAVADPAAGPGERIGRYRVLEEIGRGGQAIVVSAEDEELGRTVAIKMLDRSSIDLTDTNASRFHREARVASRLQHPGICPVFEVDTDAATPFIVMPLLSGRTLGAIVAADRVPQETALDWIIAAARALDVAHEAGIVHRDVKPANIMITDEGQPVVMDFGIARIASDDVATITRTGDMIGTLPFMAPEQVEGRRADRRTDVYALGVTLYQCLTGRLPFDRPTQRALMNAIVHEPAPDPRSFDTRVAPDLAVVLGAAMAKEPELRFSTAGAFADELERIRDHRPIVSRPASPTLRFRRWVQRNPRLAAAVITSFVLLVAGLAITLVLLADVSRERTRKQAALDELELLADQTRLAKLVAEIETLQPPSHERVAAMDVWLGKARSLAARLPLHRSTLAELRDRALPRDEAARRADRAQHPSAPEIENLRQNEAFFVAELERIPKSNAEEVDTDVIRKALGRLRAKLARDEKKVAAYRTWRFARPEDQWRHDRQARLVSELAAFTSDDAFRPTVARVEKLRAFAADVRRRTIEGYSERWQRCRAEIAADRRYGGLTLSEQVGLVPLGRDAASGLQEFVSTLTGAIPRRDAASGRLELTEETGLVLVLLPGGPARTGAIRPGGVAVAGEDHVDPSAQRWEWPVRTIPLDPFFIAKFEVTQAQWLRWTGENPSHFKPGRRDQGQPKATTPLHPVESVSWHVAKQTLRRLGLDLPTSAQWEYAARGGTGTPFFTGTDARAITKVANIADRALLRASGQPRDARELRRFDDGWPGTAPAGTFGANPFGLHDILGNVQEWCRDVSHRHEMPFRRGDGLRLAGDPFARTLRGGSYNLSWTYARCAARTELKPDAINTDLGIRPIRRVDR